MDPSKNTFTASSALTPSPSAAAMSPENSVRSSVAGSGSDVTAVSPAASSIGTASPLKSAPATPSAMMSGVDYKPITTAKPGGAGKSGKKKRKTPTDVNAPKKPVSAYVTYLNERRETVKLDNPSMTYPDILKKLAAEWSALPPDERKIYHEAANKAREKYNQQIEEYKTTDLYKKFCEEQKEEQQQQQRLNSQYPPQPKTTSVANQQRNHQQQQPQAFSPQLNQQQPFSPQRNSQRPFSPHQNNALASPQRQNLLNPSQPQPPPVANNQFRFASQRNLQLQQPPNPQLHQPSPAPPLQRQQSQPMQHANHQQQQHSMDVPTSELQRELMSNAPPRLTPLHPPLRMPPVSTSMSPNATPSPGVVSPQFNPPNLAQYRYQAPNSVANAVPITQGSNPVAVAGSGINTAMMHPNSLVTTPPISQDRAMKSRTPSTPISRQESLSYDVPIFTDEFLEFNKAREGELRQLKKHTSQLEEQNVMLSKHVENMKAAIGKLDGDALHQRTHNRNLQQQLDNLRANLSTHLGGLPLPGSKDPPNRDNIDDYMNAVYRMMTESPKPENQHFINLFKETIWNLEFSQTQM